MKLKQAKHAPRNGRYLRRLDLESTGRQYRPSFRGGGPRSVILKLRWCPGKNELNQGD